MPEHVLPTAHVLEIITLLDTEGVDPKPLLEEAGITDAELGDGKILLAKYGRFHQLALLASNNEFFGYSLGGSVPPGAFRLICLLMVHASTAQQALTRGIEFLAMTHGTRLVPTCTLLPDSMKITQTPSPELSAIEATDVLNSVSPLMLARGMVVWFHLICWLVGRRVRIRKAELPCASSPALSSLEEVLQCPIRFEGNNICIHYDLEDLQSPVVQNEESLHLFLKACPYPLMFVANETRSVGERVKLLLGRDFSKPQPSIEDMADQLGMSVSTLHRNLREEGLTYQKIKDDVRMEACVSYMAQPKLSLTEIAVMTGFRETRSFFRAFKRWVGVTPTSYRKQLIANIEVSSD